MLGCACTPSLKFYNLRGLGALGETSRALTAGEVAGFLTRNPSVAAQVAAFQQYKTYIGYSQDSSTWSNWFAQNIPGFIPQYGEAVNDSVLGTVFVFPDAYGNLQYTVSNAPTGDINNPLPPTVPFSGNWYDPLVSLATWGLVGYFVFLYASKKVSA